jgi:hypothetical protein
MFEGLTDDNFVENPLIQEDLQYTFDPMLENIGIYDRSDKECINNLVEIRYSQYDEFDKIVKQIKFLSSFTTLSVHNLSQLEKLLKRYHCIRENIYQIPDKDWENYLVQNKKTKHKPLRILINYYKEKGIIK